MTAFVEIDRPARTRRGIPDTTDDALERALPTTFLSGKAIVVPLARFHTSPAKGRLWARGYRVLHRVLPDREHVAAWVEMKDNTTEGGIDQ